jgi:hypothetical protein
LPGVIARTTSAPKNLQMLENAIMPARILIDDGRRQFPGGAGTKSFEANDPTAIAAQQGMSV